MSGSSSSGAKCDAPRPSAARSFDRSVLGTGSDYGGPSGPILKARNVLLGIAIGDAYGAGYESLTPQEVPQKFNLERYDPSPHPKAEQKAGHYTDDTQMSLAVAKLLLSEQPFTEENLAASFFNTYKRDRRVGYSSRTLKALKNGIEKGSVREFLRSTVSSATNGAAMRAVPLGVISDADEVRHCATVNAEATHRTPEAVASSNLVALASHYFFYDKGTAEGVFEFCLDHTRGMADYLDAFSMVANMSKMEPSALPGWHPQRGMQLEAVPMAAVSVLLARLFDDPTELLRAAVHLGGDTDTVSSIALGLFAARRPIASLPSFLFEGLEPNGRFGREYLLSIGTLLASLLPMPVDLKERINYPGTKPTWVTHPLDGLFEPLEPRYLQQVMRGLMRQVPYRDGDIILGVDASGYIPAVAASIETELPLMAAVKADLESELKIPFDEPDAARTHVLLYQCPQGRVIIVDDEIMTGETLLNLVEALEQNDCEVLAAVVPIESTRHDARSKLKAKGIELISHTRHCYDTKRPKLAQMTFGSSSDD